MLKRLIYLPLIIFAFTILLSFFLPIYTDEFTVHIIQGRYFLNHLEVIGLSSECLSTFHRSPPWSWIPSILITSFIYDDMSHPIKLRILGIFCFLSWLGLFSFLLKKIYTIGKQVRLWPLTLICSISAIGVLPFLMVLNRPEQWMLLGITPIILIPLIQNENRKLAHLSSWGTLFAFLFICSFLFFLHPKAIFFAPALLVFIYFTFPSWWKRLIATSGLFVFGVQTGSFSRQGMMCPENPRVNEIMGSAMLTPFDFKNNFSHAWNKVLENYIGTQEYVTNLIFQKDYVMNWLPSADRNVGRIATSVNLTIEWICYLIAGTLLIRLFFLAYDCIRERQLSYRFLMLGALLGPRIAFMGLRSSKPFYDDTLEFPLLLLMFCLAFSKEVLLRHRKIFSSCAIFLIVFGSFSQFILWKRFVPSARGEWSSGGAMPSQAFSVSAFHSQRENEQTEKLAKRCGIPLNETGKYIVMDDLTYPALWKTFRPVHSLFSYYYHVYLGPTKTLLQHYDSDGILTKCENFPKDLVGSAVREGIYCCLGKPWN